MSGNGFDGVEPAGGRFVRFDSFRSSVISPRRVDVWLPPPYDRDHRTYPVVYAQDGQNLFDPSSAFVGTAWDLQGAVAALAEEASEYAAIVVGIWNSPERIPEYMPQKPLEMPEYVAARARFALTYGGPPSSDAYLRFIVDELKPYIDRHFRTKKGLEGTVLLGSSMGGLVSLYGLCEHPTTFGRAVCMSSSWTVAGRPLLRYLEQHIPRPAGRRVYFDHGNEAQIGTYDRLQRQVDRVFLRSGYIRDVSFVSRRFPGADHSESAWRMRVDIPLRFVLR